MGPLYEDLVKVVAQLRIAIDKRFNRDVRRARAVISPKVRYGAGNFMTTSKRGQE